MQVPRIRYEVVSRNIMKGESPPVADAGPNQIGVPAGTITLNGSNSHDPNGLALTFNWVQETGPAVNLSSPTQAITTFGATSGQDYEFRLTVTNTVGLSASARVRVTTTSAAGVQILFFHSNPTSIQSGQSSQLSYRVLNATKVTISGGIGTVKLIQRHSQRFADHHHYLYVDGHEQHQHPIVNGYGNSVEPAGSDPDLYGHAHEYHSG